MSQQCHFAIKVSKHSLLLYLARHVPDTFAHWYHNLDHTLSSTETEDQLLHTGMPLIMIGRASI